MKEVEFFTVIAVSSLPPRPASAEKPSTSEQYVSVNTGGDPALHYRAHGSYKHDAESLTAFFFIHFTLGAQDAPLLMFVGATQDERVLWEGVRQALVQECLQQTGTALRVESVPIWISKPDKELYLLEIPDAP